MFSINEGVFLVDDYIKYHDISDDNEYLEDEDDRKCSENNGCSIINNYIEQHNTDKITDDMKRDIIVRLLKHTKLSQRKIAQLMEVSRKIC
ncbi:hypothetical protein PV797_21635 [Clostridiaceae bacterium M8S5]|nr:hypothetical protein PV797_21635 [Clostridiaceae bacterium M8S5]